MSVILNPLSRGFIVFIQRNRNILGLRFKYMLNNHITEPCSFSWVSLFVAFLCQSLIIHPDFVRTFVGSIMSQRQILSLCPQMEDCIDQVGSAKFVSKFDLLKGYWQVPLSERAQEVAAFVTFTGLYSYMVMPFGLRNAPAAFQRLMNRVAGDLEGC